MTPQERTTMQLALVALDCGAMPHDAHESLTACAISELRKALDAQPDCRDAFEAGRADYASVHKALTLELQQHKRAHAEVLRLAERLRKYESGSPMVLCRPTASGT